MAKFFTGQQLLTDVRGKQRESVACAKCGQPVGLRTVMPDDTGLGWFDPYAGGKGKYVHRSCLSAQRLSELATA